VVSYLPSIDWRNKQMTTVGPHDSPATESDLMATTAVPPVSAPSRKSAAIKPGLMTINETSEYLGKMDPRSIYDLGAVGELTLVKRGRSTYVIVASADAYIARMQKAVINLSKRGAERLARGQDVVAGDYNVAATRRAVEARRAAIAKRKADAVSAGDNVGADAGADADAA
jgi:hypothetical protein